MTDPFIGFHTNFNPENGLLTETGWLNKEVILLRVTDDLESLEKSLVSINASNGVTSVIENRKEVLVLEGDLLAEIGEGVDFNEVIIEVDSLGDLVAISRDFFKKSLGQFEMDESPLGGWFDPEARNDVLVEKALKKAIDEGAYNHLIPIIYTPFTKDVFQSGQLTDCSPEMFRRVLKRKLKIA